MQKKWELGEELGECADLLPTETDYCVVIAFGKDRMARISRLFIQVDE